MTEREIVSGLVSGRLGLVDVRGVEPYHFADLRLAWCFSHAREFLVLGARPTPERIVRVFELCDMDTTDLREELQQLLAEG